MQFFSFSLLGLGLLTSTVLAQGTGRGSKSPNFSHDSTCNTAPDTASTKKRVRARDFSPVEGFQFKRTSSPPLPIAEDMGQLVKRSGTYTVDASCQKAPPPESKWGPEFPTMEDVINQAFADAMTLADRAASIPNTHPAYLHYFVANEQYANVKSIMNVISSNSPSAYAVKFVCAPAQIVGSCTVESTAVTDASAASGPTDAKTITLCPLFFTLASTRFFLFEASKGTNTGVPFRDNTASGWCNSKKDANFFATIGHTVLRELTHLDAVGKAAGLTVDNEGQHGTIDAQNPTTQCELLGARSYLADYNADNELPSPDYNAESLAAAATELYFSQVCSFIEIPPKTLNIPTPSSSTSHCGPDYNTTVSNAQAMNTDLDSRGGFQCCSSGNGGCVSISTAGGQAVDLCTAADDKSVFCVDCAKVANYLDGLISSCTQDGKVGGSQDIVEAPGLSIQI